MRRQQARVTGYQGSFSRPRNSAAGPDDPASFDIVRRGLIVNQTAGRDRLAAWPWQCVPPVPPRVEMRAVIGNTANQFQRGIRANGRPQGTCLFFPLFREDI